MTDVNPLLTPSQLPYGLPDFAAIELDHVVPAVERGIAEHEAEIAAICAVDEPTWQNTVEALEVSGDDLDRATAWFFNLQGTDADDRFDAVAEKIVPLLSAHSDAIYQNAELYRALQAVTPPDDEESRRLHEHLLRAFRRRGAELDDAGKARLTELNQRLSVLSEQFGRNLLADTQKLAVRFDDAAELAGLSEARIEAARHDDGGYVLPIELPTTQSAQAELKSAASRRELFDASRARGREDNVAVATESVRLRAERARLLGYDTHADYVIADETAGDAAAAKKLITDLAPAAVANAEGEYKRVADLAAEETGDDAYEGATEVGAPDWPYWAERRRSSEFAVDGEELSRYFQLDRVVRDGVFHAAKLLFGIEVVPREDLVGYAPGVQVWEVRDADADSDADASSDAGADSGIGLILTDFFSRPTKRGGAWMSSFVEQSHLLGTKPVVVNVLNIAEPAEGEAALLTLDEVTTLFHEFGHALHGLLSDVRYPRFSGTNVPRDFVEFPSQINENWALEPSILSNYAFHVDTGEPIPGELVEAVKRARTAGEGFATTEYLAASALDLAWHSLSPEEAAAVGDVGEFEQRALEEFGLDVANLAPRYRSSYFNHIFAGGYSAGYYSYLWAEALDADGFGWFADNGGATRAGGDRFRSLILSRGGAIDFTGAYREFRGRDKDIRPLLERRGLSGADASVG
ncbi:M3 family metallopeptidase [Corynebacterium sp.]|uniref:M3 family metallopeptidase n=1 Tax=Corynebacterium sp. TaxID=1720 RepID=UPI003734CBDC